MAIALALVVLIYLALALFVVASFIASFLAVTGWWDAVMTTMFQTSRPLSRMSSLTWSIGTAW